MSQIDIDRLLEEMTLEDLCGQVLCYECIGNRGTNEEIGKLFEATKPGGLYMFNTTKERVAELTELAGRYTKVPVIISTDSENGPGGPLKNVVTLPEPMNWGACDDEALIERAGIATAEICRENGMHWSYAPVVDINYNKNAPSLDVRGISESPRQVARMAGAYVRGLQKNGLMAGGCKHFPGEGVDDRNSHFCTTINSLSKEEWMQTYGYVYKEMIRRGVSSVMIAHVALPAYQQGKENEKDEILGYKPATLSHALITDLLKGELGFEGCVISDSMCMVGACSMIDPDELAVEFLRCGGDMVVCASDKDFYHIKKAVEEGRLPIERLKDAVRRILLVKEKTRLFEDQEKVCACIQNQYNIAEIARDICEKSITLVKDVKKVLPIALKEHSRILICNLQGYDNEATRPGSYLLDTIEQELKERGHEVCAMVNPGFRDVEKELEKGVDCVLINCKLSTRDYMGGSLRADWRHFDTFWCGKVLKHPKVVFTSFGDPYKLYEFPYMSTYINAYGTTPELQRAFVKLILGEIPFQGKNPVSLPGFFEREV